MTFKAVFWDMDGTLVDSEPLHAAALAAAMRSEGLVPPPDLHERALGQTAAHIYAMMREEFGLDLPFADWIARKYSHYLADLSALKPRPGAIEIFHALKQRGVAQAVVSNSDRMIVDANLNAVGLVYPGMKTVSRNDVREGKPSAEPFLRAAWLTGVDPAEAAVVEDSVTGATAGLAAGMTAIFWPESPRMVAPPGAITVHSDAELRAVLGLE
jgi:HAD superfamily hydrolase (TIGR01509 family)